MLELKNASKIYKTKSQEVKALDNVNLYLEDKGMVFIIGKSGSGKTTMLNILGGLDDLTDGELIINNKSTKDFAKKDYDSYRNTFVGFVFQEYNLIENLTVAENLALARNLQGVKETKGDIAKILDKVGLSNVADRHPQELSGGQRQRVAIARAIIKNPAIIVADEPTGALDTTNGLQVVSLLKKLSKEKLVIVVSHDLNTADKFADRIINLEDGKVVSDLTINVDENSKKRVLLQKNVLSIKRGANLNNEDLSQVKDVVEKGMDVAVVDNINIVKENTKVHRDNNTKTCKFIKTKVGFLAIWRLGTNVLRSKKLRLLITVILCSIAFAVFGVCDSMAIYDEDRLLVNTISSTSTPSISATVNITENGGNSYSISVDDVLLSQVENTTGYNVKGIYNSYYIGKSTPTEVNNTNSYSISKYYYYKALNGVVEFNKSDLSEHGFSLLYGNLPVAYDEIAIPEYYAKCLVNWWYSYQSADGETVTVTDIAGLVNAVNPLTLTIGTTGAKVSYKIVGIVNTGRIDSKFDKLMTNFEAQSTTSQNEFLNYITNSYNLIGFVKEGFADNAYNQYGTLTKYINSSYSYKFGDTIGTISQFYNFEDLQKLVNASDSDSVGYMFIDSEKTALEGNEIMISLSQFSTIYSEKLTQLKNISDNTNGDYLTSDEIDTLVNNLTSKSLSCSEKIETFHTLVAGLDEIQSALDSISGITREESVLAETVDVVKYDANRYESGTKNPLVLTLNDSSYKIVGFFTGVSVATKVSVITSASGISNLGIDTIQGKYSSIMATDTGRGNTKKLANLFLRESGICYTCKNNAISIINTNSELFENLSLLFLIVSGVFALFSIAMFSNLIASSIKSKQTEIGILRALGATGNDIMKMFIVESVIIAVINTVVACVISVFGCILLNYFLSKYLSLYVSLAYFGIRQIFIILGLSVAVGVVSAIIPVMQISKQKPVESIRKAF